MAAAEKHIWITYSWQDNKDGDVTYIAQQLQAEGLIVHLDSGISRPAIGSGTDRCGNREQGQVRRVDDCCYAEQPE